MLRARCDGGWRSLGPTICACAEAARAPGVVPVFEPPTLQSALLLMRSSRFQSAGPRPLARLNLTLRARPSQFRAVHRVQVVGTTVAFACSLRPPWPAVSKMRPMVKNISSFFWLPGHTA